MRKHLTYSNVVATVAMFFVLGGTAIAAKAIITKSSQLGNGVVTNKKVKKGTLAKNRLSKKAQNSLKGQQGPKGEKGATGETGAQGPVGPSNAIHYSDDAHSIPPGDTDAELVTTVGSLSGDAYTFVAKFTATANNFNGVPDCYVATPIGEFDDIQDQVDSINLDAGGDAKEFVLSGAFEVNADNPRQASLKCTPDTAQGLELENVQFTLTEVGSLTTP